MIAEFSPTTLGVAAVRQAAAEAGIPTESIGLCVASSLTPLQTTPSEGQRIAGQLGLKISAYDLPGGPAAWWVHLDTFTKFKGEKLPEYIACVYSDCPNHGIDSDAAEYTGIFGDLACAVILAPRIASKLKLASISIRKEKTKPPVRFAPFRLSVLQENILSPDNLLSAIEHELQTWERSSGFARSKVTKIVLPELYAPELAAASSNLGLAGDQLASASLQTGYAPGASAPSSVGLAAKGLVAGDSILAIQCGDGYAGHAFIKVEG
jgi:3-oxoacyl-[acyl-carrier-protein] synthase III